MQTENIDFFIAEKYGEVEKQLKEIKSYLGHVPQGKCFNVQVKTFQNFI